MPELSVIITIYNVEKYLKKCIESIISQSFTSLEIILVDDGSPDNCPRICDEFSRKDSRIKVIHQRNCGCVSARWNGFLASVGKYIAFIDGDDWLESHMYEKMMQIASEKSLDMVVSGYTEEISSDWKQRKNKIPSGIYYGESINTIWTNALYTGTFYEPGIVPSLWVKIIKRDLFQKDFYPVDGCVRMGEDAGISYPLIARSNSIGIINELHAYHYVRRQGSLSVSFTPEYFLQMEQLIIGLQVNLKPYSSMYQAIPYYSLFIFWIGIQSIISKKYNLLKEYRLINSGVNSLRKLVNFETVDWNGFERKEKTYLSLLYERRVFCFLFLHTLNRVRMKIKSIFILIWKKR